MRGKSNLILVFINLLCNSDEDGVVDRHWQAIIDETGLSKDAVLDALRELESPDPQSRTAKADGRRILRLDEHRDWGWSIVNHAFYRKLRTAEERREYMRDFMRKKRAVSNLLAPVSMLADTETDTDTDTDTIPPKGGVGGGKGKGAEKKDTWKTSYEIYLNQCNSAYTALKADKEWIAQQEKFNPNLDILLSLEKAFTNFWATEAGWKHKKKARSKEINWKTTFTNALDMNKVWKPRSFDQQADSPPPVDQRKLNERYLNECLLALEHAQDNSKTDPDGIKRCLRALNNKYDKTIVNQAYEQIKQRRWGQ